jgi:voltage-gated potassium channel
MTQHKLTFFVFIRYFFQIASQVKHVIIMLLVFVILGGLLISRVEGIGLFDSLYWAFITGFTIGYGDITPHTAIGKVISLIIGLEGIIFTGIVVAISVRALAEAFKHQHEK